MSVDGNIDSQNVVIYGHSSKLRIYYRRNKKLLDFCQS